MIDRKSWAFLILGLGALGILSSIPLLEVARTGGIASWNWLMISVQPVLLVWTWIHLLTGKLA